MLILFSMALQRFELEIVGSVDKGRERAFLSLEDRDLLVGLMTSIFSMEPVICTRR